MYNPIQDGIDKTAQSVRYTEAKPPSNLGGFVHCFWELKTLNALTDDFSLHAVPDACVNILFNQLDPDIAGVTALSTKFEVLNLGKAFHYVGIQFFPGVWQGSRQEIFDSFVGTPYQGQLPLIKTSREMMPLDFSAKQPVMLALLQWLIEQEFVVANSITESILNNLEDINTVTDMANLTGLSPRQLQRMLKRSTNFTPHDLLKVLRLQRSFKQDYLDLYSDQAHFIHSFRKITGYTPVKYNKKFDV